MVVLVFGSYFFVNIYDTRWAFALQNLFIIFSRNVWPQIKQHSTYVLKLYTEFTLSVLLFLCAVYGQCVLDFMYIIIPNLPQSTYNQGCGTDLQEKHPDPDLDPIFEKNPNPDPDSNLAKNPYAE